MPTAVEIKAELEAFYKRYIDSFNREDIDQFSECFGFPYAFVSGERGLSVCANEADHQRTFGPLMANLKARGWARSETDKMSAWPMAENLAMILADVTRYKTDGAVLERVRASYTLRRDAKGWKLVTIAEIKPPFLGPGELPR
jgi:hypothetical protein